jgi:hypothetical protein
MKEHVRSVLPANNDFQLSPNRNVVALVRSEMEFLTDYIYGLPISLLPGAVQDID